MWKHWAIRTCAPLEPFQDFELSQWTWGKLKDFFPEMLAAVLMPNHFHLILPKKKVPHLDQRKISGLMGGISKRAGIKRLWQPISPPPDIPDSFHLQRQIRYVALNPCRKQLCADPLEWYWSTYRDLMGASAEKSETLKLVRSALRDHKNDFQVRFHSYVSVDSSIDVRGTPFPIPAVPQKWASLSIGEILSASAAALRLPESHIQKRGALRDLFIHMAYRHGWRQPSLLAQMCKTTRRAVHFILDREPPNGIAAADLCLGDPRLRKGTLLKSSR